MRKKVITGVGIALVVGLAGWVGGSLWVKRDVNEPAYTVIADHDGVELRQYDPIIVAATEVTGEREQALGEGFRRLAGYIFGKNQSRKEIAMTAPVSAAPSEKIAMTAPVAATLTERGTYRVTFVMPAEYTLDALPTPNDERVRLEVEPARRVAVVRFSGWATNGAVERHTEQLRAWVRNKGYVVTGSPVLAQYDPPFAMPLMRRNEVMLRLEDSPAS